MCEGRVRDMRNGIIIRSIWVPNRYHRLKCTIFWWILPAGYNAPCHKAQIISRLVSWNMTMEFTLLKWPHSHQILNPIEHSLGCGGTRDCESGIMDVQRQICSSCVMLSCQYGPKYLRNVSKHLVESMPRRIKASSEDKRGSNPVLAMCT